MTGDRNSQSWIRHFPAVSRLVLRVARRRRVPVIRQLTIADCGAASLAMVLAFHGRKVGLATLRRTLGVGRDGSGAQNLLATARRFGLRGRAVRLDIDGVNDLPQATILFWEFNHFLVFERLQGNHVHVVDPAFGRRVIPIETFGKGFTGAALVFEVSEGFQPGGVRVRHLSKRLWESLHETKILGRLISLSALGQILALASPVLTASIVDRVVPMRDYNLLLVLGLGLAVVTLFMALSGFIRSHLLIHLRTQLTVKMTLQFLDHLIAVPYAFFQNRSTGDLMMRLNSNDQVRDILTAGALSVMLDGVLVSFYLVLLFIVDVAIAGVVVLLGVCRVAVFLIFRLRQRELMAESLEVQARSQSYQVEMFEGMESLKAMGLEGKAAEHWSNLFVDAANVNIRSGKLDALFGSLLSVLGSTSPFIILILGTHRVLQGDLTLGTMLAITTVAAGFLAPLSNLVSTALQFQRLETLLERINDVLEAPREQEPGTTHVMTHFTGGLALETVSFRYSASSPLVIKSVNLHIPAGSSVALVGRSGSGKSTIGKLLAGLYAPTEGKVLIDGLDLRTLDLQSIRSRLGVVSQQVHLFGGSIRRNIALSDPTMSLDRVIRSAKLAAIHDDIIAMPMGYETVLADQGLSLSGGQRQRLALARALANEPNVLILDEATSDLDAVTEQLVSENLTTLDCTRVVIAHRLSTIRAVDQIVVLEDGEIVGTGTHADLLDHNPQYASLVAAQRD